ncbi:hypothetical protein HOLleu_25152 [Holothuria leucospilota]|uniref:Uncharacterized protein n=1 Tax=Holothuria leucospilota TaxID=206669 RepID=A0A9Q1BSA1_HOLLE|nr:hypothetical protein HOLleu_25152 [Holothuria leucospilota]
MGFICKKDPSHKSTNGKSTGEGPGASPTDLERMPFSPPAVIIRAIHIFSIFISSTRKTPANNSKNELQPVQHPSRYEPDPCYATDFNFSD